MKKIKDFESCMETLIMENEIVRKEYESPLDKNINDELIPLKIILSESIKQKTIQIKILNNIKEQLKELKEGKKEKINGVIEYIEFSIKELIDSIFLDNQTLITLNNEALSYNNYKSRKLNSQIKFVSILKEIYYMNLDD